MPGRLAIDSELARPQLFRLRRGYSALSASTGFTVAALRDGR